MTFPFEVVDCGWRGCDGCVHALFGGKCKEPKKKAVQPMGHKGFLAFGFLMQKQPSESLHFYPGNQHSSMDWDPSRDYDSQTFSDDYNLHGASARSFDHPSVTRDNDFFNQEDLNDDDYSIENADLIADIVDGKIAQDNRARSTRGGNRTGDNSGKVAKDHILCVCRRR